MVIKLRNLDTMPSFHSSNSIPQEPIDKQQEALQLLSLPDAIMEPDVLKTVNEFASLGGNINEAAERLASSYVGMDGLWR